MTTRDRMVLIGVIVLVILGAGWMLVVSPERKQASTLAAQVTSAQSQLAAAESQLSNAQGAQRQYAAAYSSIVSLGKAVPAAEEVPSLIYQLSLATDQKNVEFASIASGAAGSSSSASAAATAAVKAAGFTQMPFTFDFNGSFFDLEHLFRQLTALATRTSSGSLQVNGRLLTIQSVKLGPTSQGGGGLNSTITATAYVLPGGQGLTAGATPASPTGAATPAASTGAASSPTTPATIKATP